VPEARSRKKKTRNPFGHPNRETKQIYLAVYLRTEE